MNLILLFFFVFAISMYIFSLESDGIEEIPNEFDCIPEIANLKYQKTYQYNLYLKHMLNS